MSQEDFLEVGARIKALRGDLTQAEFAVRLGVDRKSVVGWEAGKRLPDGTSLLRLAVEFGADVNFVLTGRDSQQAQAAALSRRAAALLDNYENTDEEGKRIIEGTAKLAARSNQTKTGTDA